MAPVGLGSGFAHWGADPWFIGIAMVNGCDFLFFVSFFSIAVIFALCSNRSVDLYVENRKLNGLPALRGWFPFLDGT